MEITSGVWPVTHDTRHSHPNGAEPSSRWKDPSRRCIDTPLGNILGGLICVDVARRVLLGGSAYACRARSWDGFYVFPMTTQCMNLPKANGSFNPNHLTCSEHPSFYSWCWDCACAIATERLRRAPRFYLFYILGTVCPPVLYQCSSSFYYSTCVRANHRPPPPTKSYVEDPESE